MNQKILLLANNCSGLISFRREVVVALIKQGYDVIIHLPEDPRICELEELGCKIVKSINLSRKGKNPFKDLSLLKEYKLLISKIQPGVVLTYTIKPNIWGGIAAKSLNTPYIVNITGLGSAVENAGILQKITIYLYRIAMRKANIIFFQNEGNRDFFISHKISYENHKLIPGSGVNLAHHIVQPFPKEGTTPIFLYISRLMKEKGIEEFFKCAHHFKGRAEFHILGSCEEDYKKELESLEERNIVRYHGQQKDIRPYLAMASCLIHPTYYPEGMSNVVLEAAAAGRPVITTLRYGCKEAVDDGITGFLFPERDTEALINSVDKFLLMNNEERKEMGLRGRRKMEREFNRDIVVNAYLQAIGRILNK